MKKFLMIIFFSSINLTVALAQETDEQPGNALLFSGGYSYASTDLAGGPMLMAEYSHYLRKSWFLAFGGGTTLHDGKMETSLVDDNLNVTYGDVSFITTGLQGWAQAGIAMIRKRRHELQVKVGPMVRYQISNNVERLGSAASLPGLVWSDDMPERSYSVGGIGGISYAYTFTNQVFINLQGGLHYDTNDDGFHFVLIGVGKRFGK